MTTTLRTRRRIGLAAVTLALVLTAACEPVTVDRVNDVRADAGLASLTTSTYLTTAARQHSQAMCTAGALTQTTDPTATYAGEPALTVVELVGRATLDPTIADGGSRNAAAADEVWAGWADDPRLVDVRRDAIGVGEVACPDGRLYATLLLRDDPGTLADPGDVSQIERVGSMDEGGWRYEMYRNRAYGCSISGDQTFVVGTRIGSSPTAVRPLWVKMHGGGVGYFDADGVPRPAGNKTEESLEALVGRVDSGIMAEVRAAPEGFRLLVVSMCSHDAYAGTDTVDAGNPNTLPDGSPRTTNGLLATKAAIRFATGSLPTDDYFLQGGSAGSAGSLHVAWALQQQGLAPTGVVADSGILNQTWETAQIEQGLPCARTAEAVARVPARWDPEVADPANQPDLLVADGRLTVPLMHVWNHADRNVCGDTPMRCPLRDGSVITLGSADCIHEPMRRAIAAQGPTSRSENLAVCVDPPRGTPGQCDQHVVLTAGGRTSTEPGGPVDHIGHVFDWAIERLGDD